MEIKLPKSLYDHIASLAISAPEKTALVATDEKGVVTEEISYANLLEKILAAAAELKDLGLQKGDRIALAFRNSPALLIWSWAAWAGGIVTVPMDTKRDTPELYEYKINLNKAKLLILERGIQVAKLPGVRIKVHTGFENPRGDASWVQIAEADDTREYVRFLIRRSKDRRAAAHRSAPAAIARQRKNRARIRRRGDRRAYLQNTPRRRRVRRKHRRHGRRCFRQQAHQRRASL